MMVLQMAQMHQLIMQNAMLQALPPSALAPSGGPQAAARRPALQVGSAWGRHRAKEATQVNARGPGQLLFWELCVCNSEKHSFSSVKLLPCPLGSRGPTVWGPEIRPLEPGSPSTPLPSTPAPPTPAPAPPTPAPPTGRNQAERPGASAPPRVETGCVCAQDPQRARAAAPRAERRRPPPVHHHHHYAPPAPLQAVPAPGSVWPPGVAATALPPASSFPPAVRHVTGPQPQP